MIPQQQQPPRLDTFIWLEGSEIKYTVLAVEGQSSELPKTVSIFNLDGETTFDVIPRVRRGDLVFCSSEDFKVADMALVKEVLHMTSEVVFGSSDSSELTIMHQHGTQCLMRGINFFGYSPHPELANRWVYEITSNHDEETEKAQVDFLADVVLSRFIMTTLADTVNTSASFLDELI